MAACREHLLLEAYHDGELAEVDRALVETHLQTCAACTAELERIRAASQPLQRFRTVEMSDQQRWAVHQRVRRAADADARQMRMLASLGVIAASVLIIGLAWLRVLPKPARGAATNVASMPMNQSAWETAAVTLRPDPLTLPLQFPAGQQFAGVYNPNLADWMLDGLAERAER